MVTRSTCLCEEELIGIESIYTVVNGKQINIPDKLEALRKKSREGLLRCSCGCGAELVLVAGDSMLRQQHFRLKDAQSNIDCTFKEEGEDSINSKIVLKCWLNDKVSNEIDTRVLLKDVSDLDRKFEISHISKDKKIAVNYTYGRSNLEDEKLTLIEEKLADYNVYSIVDITNYSNNNQYPENMMKIQSRQKYCMFLEIDGREYYKARLICVYYVKDLDGLYRIRQLVDDYLYNYEFIDGQLSQGGIKIIEYFKNDKESFENEQIIEKERRIELEKQKKIEEEKIQTEMKRIEEEREKRRQEEIKAYKERMRKIAEIQKQRQEEDKKAKLEEQNKQNAEYEEQKKDVETLIDSYIDEPFIDSFGNNWYKCESCGKVGKIKDFSVFGGEHKAARGTCRDCMTCSSKNIDFELIKKNGANGNLCPECGSPLIRRNGKYGEFFGCSSYPKCKYTRNI